MHISYVLLLLALLGSAWGLRGFDTQQTIGRDEPEPEAEVEAPKKTVAVDFKSPDTLIGRLEIYPPEGTTPRCVRAQWRGDGNAVEEGNLAYLAQSDCTYSSCDRWAYDPKTRTLSSFRSTSYIATVAFQQKESLTEIYRTRLMPVSLADKILEDKILFGGIMHRPLEYNKLTPIVLGNSEESVKNGGYKLCLQASAVNYGNGIVALPILADDFSQCSLFRLVPPESDFISGSIYATNGVEEQCVVANPQAPAGTSVLSVAACDQSPQQKFLYNPINGQVRWKNPDAGHDITANPLVFMWWSGPMKFYSGMSVLEEGYNWDMPMSTYGSVQSLDKRGYSGNCWVLDGSKQVVANQTCSSFFFDRDSGTPPVYLSSSVFIEAQDTISDQTLCLAMSRVMRSFFPKGSTALASLAGKLQEAGQNRGLIPVFKLRARLCHPNVPERVVQRFVMSNLQTCEAGQTCTGHVRWSGSPANSLMWVDPRNVSSDDGTRELLPQTKREEHVDGEWVLPFREWGPVKSSVDGSCWSFKGKAKKDVVVDMTGTKCATFRIRRISDHQWARKYNLPAGVTLVQEYVGSSTARLSIDEAYANFVKNTLDLDKKLRATSSLFTADLGIFGNRRFTRFRAWNAPLKGAVRVSPNGRLIFPFIPQPNIQSSTYGLIAIRFKINQMAYNKKPYAKVLFTFERLTGCSVYITEAGHIGVHCSTLKGAYSCQYRFDSIRLNDVEDHTVSLLYSREKGQPSLLYVDHSLVGKCDTPYDWNMVDASSTLDVFGGTNWRFKGLAGLVYSVSVVTGSYDNLKEVATKYRQFSEPEPIEATQVPPLDTAWNCPYDENHRKRVTCDLIITTKDGQPYQLERDVLSLACSRPGCGIQFAADQPDVASRYQFTYMPRYPNQFKSEDVGSPSMFDDVTTISDGISMGSIGFGVEFQPDDQPLALETSAKLGTALALRDARIYLLFQSCCAQVFMNGFDSDAEDAF